MNTFTLNEYASAIASTGRKVKMGKSYLIIQCLKHDDRTPSTQVFPDGWINCLAGCGRYHISHVFPEFRENQFIKEENMDKIVEVSKIYKKYDLVELWKTLPPLPDDTQFKGIPVEVLRSLGWRLTDGKVRMMGEGYFIPYWNGGKDAVPFAQVRHLGETKRRFTFLPDAKISLYGKWNIEDGATLFVCEGTSDCAVLEYAGIPWIGIPSASCAAQLTEFAKYTLAHDIRLIYGGDNDVAGNKLLEAIDKVAPYRVCQPPKKYKDWGDFLEAENVDAITLHCGVELQKEVENPSIQLAEEMFKPASEAVNEVMF